MESPDREIPLYLNTELSSVWRVQIERFHCSISDTVCVCVCACVHACMYIRTYIFTTVGLLLLMH